MKVFLGLVVAGLAGCGKTNDGVSADALPAIDGAAIDAVAIDAPIACDPLADNDFDGAGSAHVKTGTACGSDPTVGCFGAIGDTGTSFHCMSEAPGSESLTNGATVPTGVATCAPGYIAVATTDPNGANVTACNALCKPGDAYAGNPNPQEPNGVSPHGCNNTDAEGTFGAIPDGSATSNGVHCMYSWLFEEDSLGVVHMSATSNTVGICIDHTKYKYDPNGAGTPTTLPPCAALPLHSMTSDIGADDIGCVSTTLAGVATTPRRIVYIPDFPSAILTR